MATQLSEEVAQWRLAEAAKKIERESFLTVSEVAELVRLPQRTIREYIYNGSLRAYRFSTSSRLLVKLDDVHKLLHAVPPTKGV